MLLAVTLSPLTIASGAALFFGCIVLSRVLYWTDDKIEKARKVEAQLAMEFKEDGLDHVSAFLLCRAVGDRDGSWAEVAWLARELGDPEKKSNLIKKVLTKLVPNRLKDPNCRDVIVNAVRDFLTAEKAQKLAAKQIADAEEAAAKAAAAAA